MKLYSLALFTRVQGQLVRLCAVETTFTTTRKREAWREAGRHNRRHGYTGDKQCMPEIL